MVLPSRQRSACGVLMIAPFHPSHLSYLYDSWLKWGKKRKYEVKNGWALMYFLMGSR